MAAEPLPTARLGFHGIKGDRRLALRRIHDASGFPWLTASQLPELIRFQPLRDAGADDDELPSRVVTHEGHALGTFSHELASAIERRHGAPVQMMHLQHGIFDDAVLSLIATDTIAAIAHRAGCAPDARRFRPNIVLRLERPEPFPEDAWLGGLLRLGDGDNAAMVSVTRHDLRCSMVNLDPDTAAINPGVLRAAVAAHQNQAGVYATVTRRGTLALGQPVYWRGSAAVP